MMLVTPARPTIRWPNTYALTPNVTQQIMHSLRPALDDFYNSLTDEQKAAFDAIGPERNGTTTALADDGDETPRRHHRHHHHGYSVGGMIFRMMGL
jgi:hypothetical protein